MKRIAELVDHIDEEISCAKEYAESYLDKKARGNTGLANRYKEMAEDELKHASYLHEEAMEEIELINRVYSPTVEMQEAWDTSHKLYVEKSAWIKQMLMM